MKYVLFVFHDFAGGAERCNLALLRAMREQGVACRIVSFSEEGYFRLQVPDDIPPLFVSTLYQKLRCLPKLMHEAELVIATVELQSHFWSVLFAPGKCVLHYHKSLRHYLAVKGRFFGMIYSLIVAWCLRFCRKAVGVSHDIQDYLIKLCPRSANKIIYIPNFYECDKVYEGAADPLPPHLEFFFDKHVILGVGRLSKQKNFRMLLDAFKRIRQCGIQCKLCILGEGDERSTLEKTRQDSQFAADILLPGSMNPYPAMRRAAVVCLSSYYEGFSTVLLEALALGCRVVATDSGGVRDILGNGRWGSVVPVDDTACLTESLTSILLKGDTAEAKRERILYVQAFERDRIIQNWLAAHMEMI